MTQRIQHKVQISQEQAGKRLDRVLAELLSDHSRVRLQSWIKSGFVKVNDNLAKQRLVVKDGDWVSIDAIYETFNEWQAQDISIDIIFEDKDILILNKPPALVVHPGAGNRDRTLLNALLHHDPNLETVPRAGIVQRLDKDTSGIMVVARTPESHSFLVSEIQSRNITREYQAIVFGKLTAGGTINKPIGRHPKFRTKMAVNEKGKQAITHFRIIKKYPAYTHIRVFLESGRTHQIRVHMSYLNHPLLGDPVYTGRRNLSKNISSELVKVISAFPRQALHASRLKLLHPGNKQPVEFEAKLPDDMQQLINAFENDQAE